MTASPATTDRPHVTTNDLDEIHDHLADRLIHLHHSITRLRAALMAAASDDTEWLQHRLLFTIARSEPVRLSTLAELVEVDPSTLSRQVAALVKAGLIERRADPDDGRATLIGLSSAGRRAHEKQLHRRRQHYELMLANWSAQDRRDFAALLGQFAADFDAYRPDFTRDSLHRPLLPADDDASDQPLISNLGDRP